jgi:multiple sugar transport system substrate-binding protein
LEKGIYGWGSNTAEKHRLYKKFLPFFWSYGAKIFSEDGKYSLIASDYAVEALKLYKELHDSCGYVADQRGIEDAFLAGKIGFIISGDWLLKRIELENRKINFSTTLMPGTKFPGKSFLGGEILCINNASEKKEAALKFIKFITSPDNQVKFCKANYSSTPSSKLAQKDAYFTSNPHFLTFNKQILLSNHPPVDPDWVEIEDIIEKAVEESLFGKSELVAEPLRQARHKIEALKNK